MKGYYAIGFRFDTHHVSGWNWQGVDTCHVQVYVAPDYSDDRIAAALEAIAKRIRRRPDPNLIDRPL